MTAPPVFLPVSCKKLQFSLMASSEFDLHLAYLPNVQRILSIFLGVQSVLPKRRLFSVALRRMMSIRHQQATCATRDSQRHAAMMTDAVMKKDLVLEGFIAEPQIITLGCESPVIPIRLGHMLSVSLHL